MSFSNLGTHVNRKAILMLSELLNFQGHICPAHSTYSSENFNTVCNNPLYSKSLIEHNEKEYAFEVSSASIRYGLGVTKELGLDIKNNGSKKVLLVTDPNISQLKLFTIVLDSLTSAGVHFDTFDQVHIEPTNESMLAAASFACCAPYDMFVAVGGGSVIDTCKVANLLSSEPLADLMDFVAAPIGRGLPVTSQLKPMIALPTTAGTGSETTGVAIFDHKPLKMKIGIGNRAIRPTLALIDPCHVMSMPRAVALYSGFDVFCHALESYTALPYTERSPRPSNPALRPAYQGSNPISDVWALHVLRIIAKYFRRAVHDPEDSEARSAMHLASCLAGIGFGNAGVHLCHGLSYPISGLARSFKPPAPDYPSARPLIPHGLSVVITAPAVFQFTAPMCPARHLEAAQILAAGSHKCSSSTWRNEDAGRILADVVLSYMSELGIPDGLTSLGFTRSDIPSLVKGTLPQRRVTQLSPRPALEEELGQLFEQSMTVY